MQNPAAYTNEFLPTARDVIDLVMGKTAYGVATVPQARLLKSDLTPYALPVPLDPHDPTALCSLQGGWCQAIVPDENASDDVVRKCTFRLYEFQGIDQFNTLSNRIQISTQYYRSSDHQLLLDVPLAIFLFTIPDRTLLDSGNFWDITGHGLTQELLDLGFENNYVIPANFNVVDAVRAMLMMDHLPPSQGGRQASAVPSSPSNCVGCLPGAETGTGGGYCQQGYAVSDPNAGTTPYGGGPTIRQRAATGFSVPVLYNTTIGMKIDAPSGAPIDPFTCLPMPVQIIDPGVVSSMVPGEMVPGEMVVGEP